MAISPEDRFWAKVDKSDSCWLWTGSKANGYGQFWPSKKMPRVRVHRYSYELIRGPIPTGLQLDHLCRIRHCVNPEHLEPVTGRMNILRGNGPPALNASKLVCSRGHAFTLENTLWRCAGKWRECRQCARISLRRFREKKGETK